MNTSLSLSAGYASQRKLNSPDDKCRDADLSVSTALQPRQKNFNGGKDKDTDFSMENVIYAIGWSAASNDHKPRLMKKGFLVLLGSVLLTAAFPQQSLHDIRKKGRTTFVYRLPVDSAEKYLTTGLKAIDHFLAQIPFTDFNSDSVKYDQLPTGNYLLLSVEDNELVAEYYCRTKTKVYTINNQHRLQLNIIDGTGSSIAGASVWVNKENVKYDDGSKTYKVSQKRPEYGVVKVIQHGDTSFFELSALRKKYLSPFRQRWRRFKGSRVGRVVMWLPDRVRRMITNPPRYWFRRPNRNSINGKGYVVFNKPRYLPTDTVKFKAYVLNKKGRQYNKDVNVSLSYYKNSKLVLNDLVKLKPVSKGAYTYEFVIGDSLPSDTRINVDLESTKQQGLLRSAFYIEDYLLDEVASYELRSQKENYYKNDSITFFTSAKDANGLSLMDGRVKLLLLSNTVKKFYNDRVFVPDTLWQEEKALLAEGETKFSIASKNFPAADIVLRVQAIFRNSNNEIQEKEMNVGFNHANNDLVVNEEDGILSALYYENGQLVTKQGWMENDNADKPVRVQFPFTAKIDPHVAEYRFFLHNEKGERVLEKSFEPKEYHISLNRIQKKDTVGFTLHNPRKVPVFYTIFNGNRIVELVSDSNELVKWTGHISTGKMYRLKWQYYWAGEEKYGGENILLLSKLATATIDGRSTVYPGQTDTITVSMNDYRGRPVGNANLTVTSYNSQFGRIAVPDPPYIEKFRTRLTVEYDRYEAAAAGYVRRFLLGEHQAWRTRFLLDTMPYYKFLFAGKNYHIVKTRIEEALPQVAIQVVKKGVPQEIYILYINRQPVYYNEATDQPPYSFDVYPGYAQFGFRLRDKYIQVDSIYMQPYYKHDIAFDLDSLPRGAKVTEQNKYLTWDERRMLENRMLRIENNSRNNFGFVWQGGKVVYLNGTKQHVVGPFQPLDSIRFYKPNDFDFTFQFESGYRYRVTPGVVRLEKMNLFPDWQRNVYLPEIKKTTWRIGDTILAHPEIVYPSKLIRPYLEFSGYGGNGPSKIIIDPVKDSLIAYTVIHSNDTSGGYLVLAGKVHEVTGFYPGKYNVILITQNFNIAELTNIEITTQGKYCVRFSRPVFSKSNSFIKLLQLKQKKKWGPDEESMGFINRSGLDRGLFDEDYSYAPGRTISGIITDTKGGSPIPFASIIIKGTRRGVTSDAQGRYVIRDVPYNATLVVACVGYETYEIQPSQSNLSISLRTSEASLSEVVVTSAFGLRRSNLTYAYSSIRSEDFDNLLSGRVSGMTFDPYTMLDSAIVIRGRMSVSNSTPLFVINGVPMDELPENFDTTGLSINILKPDVAVSLYGSRAANGVILINTNDFNPKAIRNQFRDYAFWQPNLFTDNDGIVKFAVTYPDNITSWQTYVVGMDKKKRMTKSSFITKAFKPLLAQLSTPQFLIEGDSVVLIGKGINYTTSAALVKTNFSIGGNTVKQDQKEITANSSFVDELRIRAASLDTINAQYTINTTAGFSDGEERKIPVFRKGIEEAIGNFWVFNSDTTVSFMPDQNAGSIKLYAQNNTLDVLLDEIKHLKEYPFYCTEQIASKLKGLIAEKKIRESLGQPFTGDKDLNKLLQKLQKGQLFNGSWGWWQEGSANWPITNYVIRTLLPLRKDPLIESNVRDGLLYLQNNLRNFKRESMLNALYTMSEAGHDMKYQQYLDKIRFDSLTLHEQWMFIKIKQQQNIDHERELKIVLDEKIETMLGGLHWGSDSYSWESNNMATTALAFSVLEKREKYKEMLNGIIQFFLERRSGGRWRNTVESAVTLETILPTILKTRNDFTTIARLNINGVSTDKFPYSQTVTNDGRPIVIAKSGGGLMYFTAWQKIFTTEPEPVTDKFKISTWFEKNGNTEVFLKAGEKITMKISIEVLKDAEYVQIEIPIPAGCTYAEKKQDEWRMHKEFYKNKLVMFAEKMNKGTQRFEIELEPRYTGTYLLNPAKAELMYFPVFYGRNEMKRVEIKK